MHIDALTCSYCIDFMKIKNGFHLAGLMTDKKNPGAGEAEPGTWSQRQKAVSYKRDHIGSLS